MKKFIVAALSLLLLTLASCSNNIDVVGEPKTYEITSKIHSLDVQIGAADFIIEKGDSFSVESNLNALSVSERNGVLVIVEEQRQFLGVNSLDYANAVLKLRVPDDIVLESVDITTGAARLTVGSLSANSVELELGAGDVEIGCLNAYYEANIEGGAGQITIASGTLKDLTLEMGVGKLNLRTQLLGNSELNFGVGKAALTLLGSKSDYKIDVEKGIGSIFVDGENVSEKFGYFGNGENFVEIEGGVGTVDIVFKPE